MGILRSHLLGSQLVENRPRVGVGVFQQVAGAHVDGVPGVAGLGGEVVVGVGKTALHLPLGLAATVGKLCLDGVVALHDRHLGCIAIGQDGGVYAVDLLGGGIEPITQALLHGVQLPLHLRKVGGEDVVVDGTRAGGRRATISVATPTAAIPTTGKDEEEQDNDPPAAIIAPAVSVTVAARGRGGYNRHREGGISSERHSIAPF